ncbi:F-box domain protein [Mycena venus]|uniref:F-box domain protein n=1 Tax=Mycena venus TaxID=2733690 RepID=A0A8H6YT12_9AGAR|nr:F-box domain protein [Mycena venus]
MTPLILCSRFRWGVEIEAPAWQCDGNGLKVGGIQSMSDFRGAVMRAADEAMRERHIHGHLWLTEHQSAGFLQFLFEVVKKAAAVSSSMMGSTCIFQNIGVVFSTSSTVNAPSPERALHSIRRSLIADMLQENAVCNICQSLL